MNNNIDYLQVGTVNGAIVSSNKKVTATSHRKYGARAFVVAVRFTTENEEMVNILKKPKNMIRSKLK